MLNAVRYLIDNGAKWRNLPADYPYCRAVYDFFRRWRRHGYVRELYQRLRRLQRTRQGGGRSRARGSSTRSPWTARKPARPQHAAMTAARCATGASATS
ncbi:transposase [Streptomyces sannanensis]|uniref:transposase n=1 Tax=Streptomyces sannanensis TaxID=285536 RepID=UPI003CD0A59B